MNYSFENNTYLLFSFFLFFPHSKSTTITRIHNDRRLNFETFRYSLRNRKFATNEWWRNCKSFFHRGVSIEMEITRNERSSNLSLSRYKTISRVLVKLDAENSRRWLRVRAKPFLFPRESFSKTLVKM